MRSEEWGQRNADLLRLDPCLSGHRDGPAQLAIPFARESKSMGYGYYPQAVTATANAGEGRGGPGERCAVPERKDFELSLF